MRRRARPTRSRGQFGWWTTEDAPAGAVRDYNGRDLLTQNMLDTGGCLEPAVPVAPFPRRRRRFRGRQGGA